MPIPFMDSSKGADMEPKQLQPSAAALAEAEALMQDLKPALAEMIERCDPAVQNLSFNDIEGHAAAVGDLLAKLSMVRLLERQPAITPTEERVAREVAFHKAGPDKQTRPPADLQMTHIPKRRRKLKTVRGEITFARDYLYFPELETGVFPPRDAAGHSGGGDDPAGQAAIAGKGGGG
jgi:hypothetical protein